MRHSAACVTSSRASRSFFRSALRGFALRFCPTAAAFLRRPPAKGVVIIGSPLPDMAGADLASVLRRDRRTSGLLLVVTGPAPYSPAQAALSLDSGADEYFLFPPEPGLFRARVLNLLSRGRNPAPAAPEEFSFGRLRISPASRSASVGGKAVRLTALEFDILLYFLRNTGRVVSRYVLLEQVWREGFASGGRTVDKRIEALRRKLGPFGSNIRTVFGLGYIFTLKS